MDETIGVKGGSNDLRRRLRITRAQKKKLLEIEEEDLKELEKRVKKKQGLVLIRTIPIVIAGGAIKSIVDSVIGNKSEDKSNDFIEYGSEPKIMIDADSEDDFTEDNYIEKPKQKIMVTPTGEKLVVSLTDNIRKKVTGEDSGITAGGNIKIGEKTKSYSENVKYEFEDDFSKIIEDAHKELERDLILNQHQEKLDQLKTRRIIEEYERLFKDIRFELRRTIYEYDVVIDQNDVIILSSEAQGLLDRLSDMIDGIELLKNKMMIENIEDYDDNYLYVLIQDYLKEFRDNKIVDEVKNSDFYINISDRLEELEEKRDKLKDDIEKKMEEFELREVRFEDLQKDFYSIDKLNKELEDFQNEQKYLIDQLEAKMKNAVSVTEKTKYEFQAMDILTRRMMRLMAFQMFLPGPKFTRGIATTGASYLHFLNRIINPPLVEKKYSVVTVQDYRKDLEYNLSSIDDASKMISKTSTQLDKMISEIKEKYADYLGVIPECDSLLNNLNRVKRDMKEKEYEMQKIRKEQELILEINNAKVKTMGEYPVN